MFACINMFTCPSVADASAQWAPVWCWQDHWSAGRFFRVTANTKQRGRWTGWLLADRVSSQPGVPHC